MARTTLCRYRSYGLKGVFQRVEYWAHAFGLGSAEDDSDHLDAIVRLSNSEKLRLSSVAAGFQGPLLTVILPIDGFAADRLSEVTAALTSQIYKRWEAVIAVDGASVEHVRELLHNMEAREGRWRVEAYPSTGDHAGRINSALTSATGGFAVFLGGGGLLREDALLLIAAEIAAHPLVRLIYGDSCVLDDKTSPQACHFRPDWNPELLLGRDYIGGFFAARLDDVLGLGGARSGFGGAESYDLLLRLLAGRDKTAVRHLPYVLYREPGIAGTGRGAEGHANAAAAGRRAVAALLNVTCPGAEVGNGPSPGTYRLELPLPDPVPSVSIVIPTRDALGVLRPCVESVLAKTSYSNFDVMVVDNQSTETAVLDYLHELERYPRCSVLRYDQPFNYSAINNFAVANARGRYICLLNNDTEIITPGWLQEMVMWASQEGIGAVGAKLLYSDDTIQHAGIVLGILGVAGHGHHGCAASASGYESLLDVVHETGAVTGACLLVDREHYQSVGGLEEDRLTVAFNDVDFCLKLRARGLRNLWTPHAVLYHHESKTRGLDNTPSKRKRFEGEIVYMQEAWGDSLYDDPVYNPNLTLDRNDFSPARSPRVPPPSVWIANALRQEVSS